MSDIMLATQEFKKGEYSLIIARNGEVVAKSKEKGVRAILSVYNEDPGLLKGAAVADKLMGRAVTMICELGKVNAIFTPLLSEGGEEILKRAKIKYEAERIVPAIKNRDNTDLCPIEKLTTGTDDSKEGVRKIKEFIAKSAR